MKAEEQSDQKTPISILFVFIHMQDVCIYQHASFCSTFSNQSVVSDRLWLNEQWSECRPGVQVLVFEIITVSCRGLPAWCVFSRKRLMHLYFISLFMIDYRKRVTADKTNRLIMSEWHCTEKWFLIFPSYKLLLFIHVRDWSCHFFSTSCSESTFMLLKQLSP